MVTEKFKYIGAIWIYSRFTIKKGKKLTRSTMSTPKEETCFKIKDKLLET